MDLYMTIVTGWVVLILCHGTTGQTDTPVTRVKFTNSQESQSYLAGNSATFVCTAYGGRPQPKINWYINNELLKARQHNSQSSVRGTLDVIMTREMDRKSLICEASNGVGEAKRSNTTLSVRYSPYVTVRYDEKTNTVICSAYGNPDSFKLERWYRRVGTEISPMTSFTSLSNSSWALQLKEGSYNDIGYYTCTVSNELGIGSSSEELVQPWGAPVFLTPISNYTTYAESNLTINFDVYSSPPVAKFSWMRDDASVTFTDWDDVTQVSYANVTILVRDNPMHVTGQLVTLEMINVTLGVTGNYTLVLTTERGQETKQHVSILVLEKVVVTTPAGPIMLESGMGTGTIVLIIGIITCINVIVCLGVIYWRSRKISQRKAKAKPDRRSQEMFLPVVSDGTSGEAPTPPRRTTSVGKVRPKVKEVGHQSHYAELDFGHLKSNKNRNPVTRKDPPTEYAWIDFRSSCSSGAS